MKRFTAIICFVVLAALILTGCSANKHLQLKDLYHEVVGFSDSGEAFSPVPQDTILMLTNEEYRAFKDEYFTKRDLSIASPDPEKAVLYIQIPSDSTAVDTYSVQNIVVKNNVMTVSLKNIGTAMVDPAAGFVGTFKWVMFLELDKARLKEDMKIVINK